MEILNIEYHTGRLVLKALNKCHTKAEAAAMLGVTERHVYNYIDHYRIEYKNEQYQFNQRSVMHRYKQQNPIPETV